MNNRENIVLNTKIRVLTQKIEKLINSGNHFVANILLKKLNELTKTENTILAEPEVLAEPIIMVEEPVVEALPEPVVEPEVLAEPIIETEIISTEEDYVEKPKKTSKKTTAKRSLTPAKKRKSKKGEI